MRPRRLDVPATTTKGRGGKEIADRVVASVVENTAPDMPEGAMPCGQRRGPEPLTRFGLLSGQRHCQASRRRAVHGQIAAHGPLNTAASAQGPGRTSQNSPHTAMKVPPTCTQKNSVTSTGERNDRGTTHNSPEFELPKLRVNCSRHRAVHLALHASGGQRGNKTPQAVQQQAGGAWEARSHAAE